MHAETDLELLLITMSASKAPVTVRRPDPTAWRHALALADSDVRRLSVVEGSGVNEELGA